MLREVLYFEDVIYRIESLMVYSAIKQDVIMNALKETSVIISYDPKLKGINEKYYAFASGLLAKAEELGLSGNLLRQYSIYLFLNDKNHLSMACENGVDVKDTTLYKTALKDMGVLQYLMDFDLQNLCENVGYGEKLYEYTPSCPKEYPEIDMLSSCESGQELLDRLIWRYTNMGCGDNLDIRAYRLDDDGLLSPVRYNSASFGRIYGYGRQIAALKANTERFLDGKHANSLLLTGSRGIGKYSCLRALADQYSEKNVCIVEVGKSGFKHLRRLMDELARRHRKYIIIADELSAADVAEHYDSLSVLLGASLEMRPSNVLFYAVGDCPEEYFDEVIDFSELSETEFQNVAAQIAKALKVAVPMDFLKAQALEWVGGKPERSAKTARAFVKQVIWELEQK